MNFADENGTRIEEDLRILAKGGHRVGSDGGSSLLLLGLASRAAKLYFGWRRMSSRKALG